MQIVRESHGKLPMAIASGGTHETVEGIPVSYTHLTLPTNRGV